MSFVKRTWKDRVSEYPNRRTINDGYTTKQVTVGRDEGSVTEEGDAFNAANMNDLEDRIYAAVESGGGGGGSGTYDYDDLMNKPTINSVQLAGNKTTADLHISYNDLEDTPNLANVAETGNYNDLINTPVPETAVNFTSQVSLVGTVGNSTQFYKKDNVVYINYQGATGTHAANDTLFTLPAGYRPLNNLSAPFTLNGAAYGSVSIGASTGICKINFISNSSMDGRIYFNLAYPTV